MRIWFPSAQKWRWKKPLNLTKRLLSMKMAVPVSGAVFFRLAVTAKQRLEQQFTKFDQHC